MAGKPRGDFLSPSPRRDWGDDRAATRLLSRAEAPVEASVAQVPLMEYNA